VRWGCKGTCFTFKPPNLFSKNFFKTLRLNHPHHQPLSEAGCKGTCFHFNLPKLFFRKPLKPASAKAQTIKTNNPETEELLETPYRPSAAGCKGTCFNSTPPNLFSKKKTQQPQQQHTHPKSFPTPNLKN
jgi:hypothetical protein